MNTVHFSVGDAITMANPILTNRHQPHTPSKNSPFSWGMWTHLTHQFLSRPHSAPQTTSRLIHTFSHNYTTNSPLVTMGCPTFTPKTAHSPLTISTLSNKPIPRPTPCTTQMASRCNQPFPQFTHQTDRLTDTWDRRQMYSSV